MTRTHSPAPADLARQTLGHLLLLNPNTSRLTTRRMLRAARQGPGAGLTITARTAAFGTALITDDAALRTAEEAVLDIAALPLDPPPDAVVVAAFGDPGLDRLRSRFSCPVIGLAEASMTEAAAGDRRFAVATTTPLLAEAIRRSAVHYGFGALLTSVRTTKDDPDRLMEDPPALQAALYREVDRAVNEDGAEAVVVGGGPLVSVARWLSREFSVPVIEPVPAAIRAVLRALG
ncbi:aspartate/glutamate racemase family protein [Celeribacter indicus]|uniref:Hydantoin racemase n=1 Tax=Celeribacter indicus TaxID=1208324 RepID=A0A0B5E925_9RHOB|nr:aspartate/glutamate racemase family protein [Celeribacter indicus]AJE48822.1 hydantoin racemase [Celeribacter indicus]SDW38355.1 Asp/Glu/hydantoin racemase [Celeribacter indicus]